MQKLRFAGVSDDGQHLVLETWDGEQQFHTVIDQTLRNAVVKARKAPPARPLNGDGSFGPRDIQTRFRQGASVDEIVAESGWKPERVRRYEWPILAERSHMVAAAREVRVEPLDGSEPKPLNHQVVAVRETWNFADGDAQWNSWQREDGLWNVSVSVDYSRQALDRIPEGSDFPARFVFNPHNHTVRAGNAVAEFLLGRLPEHETAVEPAPHEPAGTQSSEDVPTQHSSEKEPDPSADHEAPSGQAASASTVAEETTRGTNDSASPTDGTAAASSASESLEAARLHAVPVPETTDQDRLLEELDSRRGTRPGQDPASDARVRDLSDRVRASAAGEERAQHDAESGPAADAEPPVEPDSHATGEKSSDDGETGRPRGRAKRPSVPSWDDIVFGSKH